MKGRVLLILVLCGLSAVWSSTGCGPGPTYQEARQAEQEGSPQVAYEDYCRAAEKHPGSAATATGIQRTGPAAVAYWQSQAWQAMDQGRYADAWRMLMRALEIHPDDPTVLRLIRQLETQHADQLAEARTDYRRRGSQALATPALARRTAEAAMPGPGASAPAIVDATPPAAETAVDGPSQTVDQSTQVHSVAPSPRSMSAGRSTPSPVATAEKPPGLAKPGAIRAGVPPPSPPAQPSVLESQRVHREWAEAFARTDRDLKATAQPRNEPTEKQQRPPEKPRRAEETVRQPAARPAGAPRLEPAKSAEQASAIGEFLTLRTLSKKDKRFPAETHLIDGITVKLKGTDDDPDADLDLLEGKKRIKKIRGLRIGGSQAFFGHSGLQFRLVVLGIHHKTDTVRVGVQELPGSKAPPPQ